ncbi:MAG: hypothetical protein HYW95_02835 [Candidatus Wildermuthbacteria bacterium]|nr:hypothetical protein [Candidatus Wildermuthbacteria bacterium]
MGIIQGSTGTLKEVLGMLGVSITKFAFQGHNSSDSCGQQGVHPPHVLEEYRHYCIGKAGCVGEDVLIVIAEERQLYPARAKGIYFLLPRNAFPSFRDPLMQVGVGQGPGYTG